MTELLIAILVVLVILLALALVWLLVRMASYRLKMEREFDAHKAKWEKDIRQDAATRSRAVTIGKITEHLVPYLPDFAYNPNDARFLGSPIDLVVFDGLGNGYVKSIVFIEIKTGKTARLSSRERQVRSAVEDRRVSWEMLKAASPTA